ncbi:MAG: DUF6036 family nucleotidyltransferase [Oscillospiraceae bacterium]|nr:DUF6036 family nucleotidyltransferase [Oscillospiraceae bacterium]
MDCQIDKEQILSLLHELGDELARNQSFATINVCGGAAIAIAYNSQKASDDIDAVLVDFDERGKFFDCVKQVAVRHGLPENWLNEDVKIFVNSLREYSYLDFGKLGALSIRIASEEQLLAMKLFAARRKDLADAMLLCKSLNIQTKESLSEVLEKYFSERSRNFELFRLKDDMRFSDFQDEIISALKEERELTGC